MPPLRLITDRDDDPVVDTALSTAVLNHVAAGSAPASLRLFVPGRIVAFGSQDATRTGYAAAVEAVRQIGFDAVERLAGGKAAVFHESTIAFAWATPHDDPKTGIEQRFEAISDIIVTALRNLGVHGDVGETPGEYCPGRFSVHANGRKVMGVGQRLIRGAAHIGGVLVADDADLVNAALNPAYRLLEYDWDPDTTGAVGASVADASAALNDAFAAAGHDLAVDGFTASERAMAVDLAERHRPPIA
jgi:lipoate-protein ligase A